MCSKAFLPLLVHTIAHGSEMKIGSVFCSHVFVCVHVLVAGVFVAMEHAIRKDGNCKELYFKLLFYVKCW